MSSRRKRKIKRAGAAEPSAKVPAAPTAEERPAVDLRKVVGSGKGLFSSPEEVDSYIHALRDEWDS